MVIAVKLAVFIIGTYYYAVVNIHLKIISELRIDIGQRFVEPKLLCIDI